VGPSQRPPPNVAVQATSHVQICYPTETPTVPWDKWDYPWDSHMCSPPPPYTLRPTHPGVLSHPTVPWDGRDCLRDSHMSHTQVYPQIPVSCPVPWSHGELCLMNDANKMSNGCCVHTGYVIIYAYSSASIRPELSGVTALIRSTSTN